MISKKCSLTDIKNVVDQGSDDVFYFNPVTGNILGGHVPFLGLRKFCYKVSGNGLTKISYLPKNTAPVVAPGEYAFADRIQVSGTPSIGASDAEIMEDIFVQTHLNVKGTRGNCPVFCFFIAGNHYLRIRKPYDKQRAQDKIVSFIAQAGTHTRYYGMKSKPLVDIREEIERRPIHALLTYSDIHHGVVAKDYVLAM